ncbi:hypothetical protein F1880_009340 [Penicillium rolfsii]|nr:hypothetical protein F1880_009340 [Penicillium rolfsii]
MCQPPWQDQLPGVMDSQVGTSDFPNRDFPWNQEPAVPPTESVDSHTLLQPMAMNREMTRQGYENYSDTHRTIATEAVESFSPSSQRDIPVTPSNVDGNMAMPPGYWIWQPMGLAQNHLPPISSLGFGQCVPNTWNHPDSQLPPFASGGQPASSPISLDVAEIERLSDCIETASESLEPCPQETKDETHGFDPLCEFSRPCKMSPSPDGVHFRKIVSHLFGRNKASTKLFPDYVWVYYCRKHYQRARYRAEQWPFNQCELLMQSLDRMEEWGNVLFFELRLRRREALRAGGQGGRPTPTGLLRNGRRHPTAITAPVPDWLQHEVGTRKSFADIRQIVKRIRSYLTRLKKEEDSKKMARGKTSGAAILAKDEKTAHNAAHRERNSLVRFPDIEILPTFHPRVLEEAHQRTSQKKRGNKEGSESANERKESNVQEEDSEDEGEDMQETSGKGRHRKGLKLVTRVSSKGAIKKPAAKKRN